MESYKKKHTYFTIKAQCSPENKKEEKYVLELKPFAVAPRVLFDKVKIGTSKTCTLFLFNPLLVQQLVCIEKFPFEKGFNIPEVKFCVPPLEEISINITWTPEKSINCRENVLFKTSAGTRAQVFFLGTAHTPKKKKCWDKRAIQKSPRLHKNTSMNKNMPASFIFEEKKENLNLLDWKTEDLSVVNTPRFFPAKQSCLGQIEELCDSPVRRQTYTINSMLRASQIGTDIKNLPFCLPTNHIKYDGIFKENIKESRKTFVKSDLALHKELDSGLFTLTESEVKSDNRKTFSMADVKPTLLKKLSSDQFNQSQGYNKLTKHKLVFKENPESGNCKTISISDIKSKCQNELNADQFNPSEMSQSPIQDENVFNEKLIKSNENLKTINFLEANPSLSRGLNIIQTERQQEIFNDSLESTTSDYCAENIHELENCTEKSTALNFNMISYDCNVEATDKHNFPLSISYSNNESASVFQGRKRLNCTDLDSFTVFKRPCPPVAFEVSNADLPKPRETTFNLPHCLSNQNRVTKSKNVIKIPKKRIRTLKLSEPIGTPKKIKEKIIQRNPYASFNSYYDEYWKEKQESAFTNWLNFILTPNDDFKSADVKVNSAEIWVESMKTAAPLRAPSKEELSFKTYTAIKQLNQLREAAYALYHSEKSSAVIKKVEKEVDMKKLMIRKDRALHADLGIKQDLLQMLLSYNPLWLRIGLETIYGEIIPLQSNSDIIGLSRFIIHRFLSNPDIAAKYAYSSVIKYYKPGYEDCIKQFTLKKFLIIIYFLDVAKRARLINHNPCLFCKSSKYKNSRSLLLTFSREYLFGEGDVTKHLRYLGYVVQHEQTSLEEFDYAVRNIAVDLRCGLRLGRVVEILLQDWEIFKALRANTLNRLTKIHNNEVIMQALQRASLQIEDNIDPRDIVDGNREKTLSLLWQIIFKTQISKHVNLELIKKENSYLRRSLKLKADVATFNAVLQNLDKEAKSFQIGFLNSKLYKENEVIQQLLQWCQNVCAHYGIKVLNFTTSFSDGRALCCIVHHYHPNLLPQDKIKKETSCYYFEKQENEDCPFPSDTEMSSEQTGKFVKNEKDNLDLAFQKFQEIGQIPIMSFPTHIQNNRIPDEKVVITLVSYVNIRLMELSVEIRAARTILLAYRKWCLKKRQKKLAMQIDAIVKIQRFWRSHLLHKKRKEENAAAICIQRFWKMISAKKELERLKFAKHLIYLNKQACVIQAAFRRFKASKYQQRRQEAIVLLQSHVRKWLQRKEYLKLRSSAIKVQQRWRARRIGKEIRSLYLIKKNLIIILQSYIRQWITQKDFKKKRQSAIIIQKNVRKWIAQRKFSELKSSVLCIENWYANIALSRRIRQDYMTCRQAVVKIQATWKMCCEKRNFKKLMKAISIVNLYRRGKKQRMMYLYEREKIIRMQALFRRNKCRREFCWQKKAAVRIQSAFRMYSARKKFLTTKSAILKIQKYYRSYRMMCSDNCKFLIMKTGFTKLQAFYQGYKTRKEFYKQRKAIIHIQSAFRRYSCQKKFFVLKSSAIKIQRYYQNYRLMYIEKQKFLIQKVGFTKLQALVRANKARKEFCKQKTAVIVIQSIFRSYICRKKFLTQKSCAIKIQMYYRNYQLMNYEKRNYQIQRIGFIKLQAQFRANKASKEFCTLKKAAVIIQSKFRSYTTRKKYLLLRLCSIKIQKYYRGYRLMEYEKQKYTIQKIGFTKLQSQYRAYKARKKFSASKKAAILIQSTFKGCMARKRYLTQKSSVAKIQLYYRGYQLMCYEKKNYLIQRVGFTKFQALFRAYKARKEFCEQKKAAVIIQRKFRSYIGRRKYLIIKSSVLKIQNYYRGYRLMCLEKEKYLIQKIGFIELQAQFRAYKARKEFYMQKRAAILIQSTFKSYITRKRFLRLRLCAIKIQKYYRSYCLMSSDRCKYLIQKAGFTKLQACFQGFKVRRKFGEQKRAVVVMQSQFRSYINRKKFLILKSCAIKIQKFYRGYRLMCFQKQNYLIQKNGFLKLQAQFRAFKAKKEFCMQKRSVVVIQNAFKCYITKKKYFILKSSVVKIQRYYRGYKWMCLEKQKYLTMQMGFRKLQALCRGIIARSYFKSLLKSTVIIQSHCKKMIVMNHYKKIKQSCIIIQQKYRAQQLMKKAVLKFQKIKRSIIIIQSAVRSYLVRKKYMNMKIAAIKIQSFARMVKCRKTYNYTCRQIIFIQQFYRAKYLMRLRKQSCIKIQSCWKSYKTRKELDRKIRAAEVIQRYFHLWREKKPHIDCAGNRQWYLKLKESTIFFQRQARIYLQRRTKSAILIQSYVRMWLTRLKYIRIKAAIKIQTLWRGYKVRQSVTDKNIIKSRQNIKAAPSSEHKSLGNRTKFALNLLLKNQNLATILHALQNLEVCTRLSPTCCERLKESGGISIILQAISVCNRSVPHQEIIKFSTDILLNLAKYKKTVDSVWAEEAILTEGLRLMGVYRDKGLPIFTKCCTLFWIFCQDPKKSQILRENAFFVQQIQHFYNLALRQKKNYSKTTANLSAKHSRLKMHDTVNPRESIEPDWVLAHFNKREFKDAFTAISSLIHSLGLRT